MKYITWDETIYTFRKFTGLSEDEVMEGFKKTKCSVNDLIGYMKLKGEFPDSLNEEVLVKMGFDAWYALYNIKMI